MRIIHTIFQDIKFQFKYGFYFIYTVMILFYAVIIGFLPESWKGIATVIILFADPAALGFYFIGGIMLLEKGERVLDVFFVSPIKIWEYVLAKAASLSFISILVGLIIALIGLGIQVNTLILIPSMLVGSLLYTFVGIAVGVNSKSVNQFLIITIPAEMFLSVPPVLLLFGVKSIILEVLPGSLILRLFQWSTGIYSFANPILLFAGLILWCIPTFYLAVRRTESFLSKIGGEAYETSAQNPQK